MHKLFFLKDAGIQEQTILISAKYNHKLIMETILLPSGRFSMTFQNIQNFLVKNEKKSEKFGLNYLRHIVQTLVLHILKCSF